MLLSECVRVHGCLCVYLWVSGCLSDVICVWVGMCVCVSLGPMCACLASGIYVCVGVNVFLMVFVGEWVCVDVCVCVCVCVCLG